MKPEVRHCIHIIASSRVFTKYLYLAITNSATAAARSMAGKTFDVARSRSAFEGNMANVAGKGSPAQFMSIKKARQMDQHALVDSLSGALSSSTREFTDVMRAYLPTPEAKRQKTSKDIQEEILLVIEEIQKYSSINSNHDFDKDIETAKARLKSLQRQRDGDDNNSAIVL